MSLLVLDIEAVRDKRVVPDPDPPDEKFFAPPHGWAPIVIGCVLLERDGRVWKTVRLGAIEGGAAGQGLAERERVVLTSFAEFMQRGRHDLVTWNGRAFDLPVLMLRGMRLGLQFPWYYQSRDHRYRYSEDGHCDLADAMADYGAARHMGLDGMAKLIGLPGKFGEIGGAQVGEAFEAGRHEEIATYCKLDAVQTAFLFLRWQLLKGAMGSAEYRQSAGSLMDACRAVPAFEAFVARCNLPVLFLEEA